MSRGNIIIHRPPLGTQVKVTVSRKIRQAVRQKLVQFGGTEGDQFTVKGIPERYVSQIETLFATEYPEWEVTTDDLRVVYRELEDNIAWTTEPGPYGLRARNGYVGRRKLFTIGESYKRDDPESYLLYTSLSDYNGVVAKASTARGAEKAAEAYLEAFLENIGAQMKERS
jgi:hypothetical protein